MMTYKNQDFELWAGEDKIIRFKIDNVDELYGTQANWRLASAINNSIVMERLVNNDLGLSVDIPLFSGETKELTPGNYYHILEIIDAEGSNITVATGKMILRSAY